MGLRATRWPCARRSILSSGVPQGGSVRGFFEAFFAADDLGSDDQAIWEQGAFRVFGFGEQFGDLVFEEFHLLRGVALDDRSVFAGAGKDYLILDIWRCLIAQVKLQP